MKIIQVSSYFPPHLGGMENVVKEISERLAKKGHNVEVFTSDIGCPKDKQLKSTKNLKIHYLKAWELAHTPIIPSLLFKLMKIPKDSIIHVHVAQAFIPEVILVVSKLRGTHYVAQIHIDSDPSSWIGKIILNPYKKIFLKRVLTNAKKIIVLNEKNKDKFKNSGIIKNGVDNNLFINKKINKKAKNILFVGRLSIQKNIPRLLKAFSLIKNKMTLHIVGEGEKRQEIENLIKELKLKNIVLHGRKEGKELIALYKKADIFVLTSDKEGSPLVLYEAMASGTPIIASDVQGVNDLIKGIGILVSPTPENFAKAIDKLIENPILRRKIAEKGRKKVEQYKWDKIIPKYEEIYKEVIRTHANKQ